MPLYAPPVKMAKLWNDEPPICPRKKPPVVLDDADDDALFNAAFTNKVLNSCYLDTREIRQRLTTCDAKLSCECGAYSARYGSLVFRGLYADEPTKPCQDRYGFVESNGDPWFLVLDGHGPNGHACALQYSMLHLTGYDLSLDDLKLFRQCDSKTPGHPENFCTAGVEVSTGPLGQGLSNAVGMAVAEANLAATFNKEGHDIVNHYTYVICGDGCLQEGVTSEACSFAGLFYFMDIIIG